MWGDIAIAFLLAFITAFMMTPYSIKLAKKVGAVDVPKDNRRMHHKSIPKLGGIAVIAGFVVSCIYLLITMSIEDASKLNLFGKPQYGVKLIGFFVGVLILGITCFIDDTKGIKPLTKLTGQVLAAIAVVVAGIRIVDTIPIFDSAVANEAITIILTILWIVGITNAINLMDGLDGLSSGITMISCISLLIIFSLNNSPLIAIILITALGGALCGFLPFNFNPAKTFIGDIGSNFLGFTLSVVSILGVARTYTAVVIVLPVIVLGLPIFDTIYAILRRLHNGKSIKAIFKADKGHLHHRLVRKGFSHKQSVYILYGISATFGMFAVILFESGIIKAISFALMVIAVIALGYRSFSNLRGEEGCSYECSNCKYIYNPKVGNETAGIDPNTEFYDLPDDWRCPVCGERKDMFMPRDDI